ncbi:hypothetical protein [Paraglaciecola sp.]|uniref:hypothetical protein n=1 Tax=Paraglaciecola sp. TaxID=1920173 RepID=UPI003EF49B64
MNKKLLCSLLLPLLLTVSSNVSALLITLEDNIADGINISSNDTDFCRAYPFACLYDDYEVGEFDLTSLNLIYNNPIFNSAKIIFDFDGTDVRTYNSYTTRVTSSITEYHRDSIDAYESGVVTVAGGANSAIPFTSSNSETREIIRDELVFNPVSFPPFKRIIDVEVLTEEINGGPLQMEWFASALDLENMMTTGSLMYQVRALSGDFDLNFARLEIDLTAGETITVPEPTMLSLLACWVIFILRRKGISARK